MTQIRIVVEMEEDIWLADGDEWVEPVFGSWKLSNTGLTKSTETITIDTDDEDGTLTFENNDGKKVEIPFVADGAGALDWGDDADLAALGSAGGVEYADGQS